LGVSVQFSEICSLACFGGTCFVTTDSITQKGIIFPMNLMEKAVNRCPNGYASVVLWVGL
jgi:hypothetical protein